MGLFDLYTLALALSMDAFAISLCKGLGMKKANLKGMAICGIWFGGFQGLMSLAGFLLGNQFAERIESFDYLVAFGLLAVIGINMLKEAFSSDCECGDDRNADLSFKTMLTMAVATSIDALAGGITIATKGVESIWVAVALIGGITFLMAGAGVKIGSIFGDKFEKKAQIVGGVILILLGLKIFIEHFLHK